jgi:hypothetical protein
MLELSIRGRSVSGFLRIGGTGNGNRMSDWIKEAIEKASGKRGTEMEYALLRERTFGRLFPALEKDVFDAIRRDVATYNAHVGADSARLIRASALEAGGTVPLVLEKKGSPPFGHITIMINEASRTINAMLRQIPLGSNKEEMALQSYDVRLMDEQLIIEREGGGVVSVAELSRAILEPFFLAVA